MDDSSKLWYTSKTVLLNIVMGVITAVSAAWPHATVVSTFISSNMATIGSVWGILGVALRFITKDKIVLKD